MTVPAERSLPDLLVIHPEVADYPQAAPSLPTGELVEGSYAVRYARELEHDPERSDRFVGMYVNEWTRGYGSAGRRAVQTLLDRGHAAGILPRRIEAEFVEV